MSVARVCLFGFGILALAVSASAQKLASAVKVDGELDEAAWSRAEPITAFVQRAPNEGAPPTHRTEARIVYDDEAMYIAVKAFDAQPDQIKAFLTPLAMRSRFLSVCAVPWTSVPAGITSLPA
jgi:hypothetical protein